MSKQRTHALLVVTETRGEFLVHTGDEETIGKASDSLYETLNGLDRDKGMIRVSLPASEVIALIQQELD